MDYDNDGTIDAGEIIHSGNSGGTNTTNTVSANITIPTNATESVILRMRVMGETGSAPSNSDKTCSGNYFVGDVEDYGVMISPDGSLPLNEINLTVQTNAQNHNIIKWIGDDEENVLYYELETSLNGSDYFTLARVEKQDGVSSYQYTDKNPAEKSYYRVTAYLTFNGKLSSKPVLAQMKVYRQISVYPNPTEGKIIINGRAQKLLISNIYGQLVQEVQLNSEANHQDINMGNLAEGVYILRFLQNDVPVHTQKLIMN